MQTNMKCGQIGGAAATPSPAVTHATGVEFAMESLDAGIYSLRDSLDALERRLAIVTKPLVLEDGESAVLWPECVSPLEDGLYNRASLVWQQVNRCKDLLSRLAT